ncbi:MAG: hypothetical protein MMC33_006699 [Icmadophila ericetorum]|nr:hypothetical protein [Icmadophila ericetorum]
MNLGNTSLKSVNSARPQLQHTLSKQSVAASDDYYSLSDHGSDVSERTTIVRYKTPPSQMRSPEGSQDVIHANHAEQSTHPRVEKVTENLRRPENMRVDTAKTVKMLPPEVGSPKVWKQLSSDISPPTPGVDDTPYIQFAIDQLTRDEELLGRSRPHPGAAPTEDSFSERRVTRDGESVVPPEQERGSAREEEQEEEEMQFPSAEEYAFAERQLNPNVENTNEPRFPRDQLEITEVEDLQDLEPERTTTNNILLPAEPEYDEYRYPKLDFVPGPLRSLPILFLVLYCLVLIALLIYCSFYAAKHDGLLSYNGVGTGRYFLFEFLPQIFASIVAIWLLVIQNAIQRVLPFSVLASESAAHHPAALNDIPLFSTNSMIPSLSLFKHGEPTLGAISIVFWLCLFSVPLASAVFQTRFFTDVIPAGVWIWTTVQPVAWTLLGLYVLLVIALIMVYLRFAMQPTGLKWDPVSLADIVVLLQGSNLLSAFNRLRGNANQQQLRNSRLGYWSTSARPGDIFYGIGEEHAPVPRYHLEKGKTQAQPPPEDALQAPLDIEAQRPESIKERYQFIPWFLRDLWVVVWLVIAYILVIAFLVASFFRHAVQVGFLPRLSSPATALGFSPADFLYSFIPSLIGLILFLLWQPIDMYFRALQPFANISISRGASAENSLLLNYTSCLPIEVSIRAALVGHYKLAWISLMSAISIVLPILAGGIFTAQFFPTDGQIRTAAYMPAFYVLVAFVLLYALSLAAIFPTRKRHLPHNVNTLADLIGYVGHRGLVGDETFRETRSKIDMVTKLLAGASGTFVLRDSVDGWRIERVISKRWS